MSDVAFVLGTRLEAIGLAPVIEACRRRDMEYAVIHTGQRHPETHDTAFFDRLDLPQPEYTLGVGSASEGRQTGEMLIGLDRTLREISPEVVLVYGHTNSALAGAIAAGKLDTRSGHVDAGPGNHDRTTPEWMNRTVAHHVSDLLFAPTEGDENYLVRKGVSPLRITVTGSPVVDATRRHRDIARRKSTILEDLGLESRGFFLLTTDRDGTVDDRTRFERLLSGVGRAATKHGRDVVYPVRPRARDRLDAFGIELPDRIRRIDPPDYLDVLRLEAAAEAILTDADDVQKRACVLGVPCVTTREETARAETVDVGANRLSSCDPDRIVRRVAEAIDRPGDWRNPFGDGDATERILAELPVESTTDRLVS
ncbi:UDP-N-acetylglucosamine 2-epimerase (non-hydrolyzing) [Halorubrum sp. 48-1-W]|uniref:non-hydrolyzing UDP-N-acetylglucosamine 2-epimerase n=1 Tax=Halorubrum sp. 48-1-W TaxID=2249761 RepID=UPI000DCC9300|nr:UDP-N-acetylglucosamine 2-epimerase (non-hydrolyzing) [Halorubrum sp. 48-1-W]RAW45646.1 UDP-N-acetylglucosamine 2-epimerase (non-hydrolyzing) [Halorubrum sp. 48-1-W]